MRKNLDIDDLIKSRVLIFVGGIGSGKTYHLLQIINRLKDSEHLIIYSNNDGDSENYKQFQNNSLIQLYNNDNLLMFLNKVDAIKNHNEPTTIIMDGFSEIVSLEIQRLLDVDNPNIQLIVATQKLSENQLIKHNPNIIML